ncbi:MAG: 23S rRNA (guanosine(2251)-2'-O)-methyltransferase RlmB [Actinomycetales bacterium]
MAGNSQRRGAVRKAGSKKGASAGTGGHGRRALEGKGPTPKAQDRSWHKGYRASSGSSGQRRGAARRSDRQRRSGGPEYIAGRNAVVEALRAQIPATALYVASRIDSDDRVKEAIKLAAERGLPLMEGSRTDLDRLTDDAIHQGLVLAVPAYDYADLDELLDIAEASGRPALIIALDAVTDPRNLGAVVRSAAAFGAHGVLVPERRAAGMSAGAWKTSAGAASRLRVARASNLTKALTEAKKAGCFVVGLDADGDVELPGLGLATDPLVIVVGSEGKGLSRLVREACDQIVSIPMDSETESLNAGVAAGIALYEVASRRARAE